MAQTLCLNMIVKNESHIIVETLEHLVSNFKFDYWVISDTGSTDNTKELINEFFKTHKIAGELVEHEWKDFGHNRTKALEAAYNKTDYLLIFDADDRAHGVVKFPENLDKECYLLKFAKAFVYYRPLLINNRIKWCFKGILHEFLSKPETDQYDTTYLEGNYYIESRQLGDRSKNPKKYLDDAELLKVAYEKERLCGEKILYCRYAFYCAQSYKDAGKEHYDESIVWYKKCMELDNGYQEKYVSAINISGMYLLKNDTDNALHYFYKSAEYDLERIDGIATAMKILCDKKEYILVNALYHRFKNYTLITKDKLFVNPAPYLNCDIEYYGAISSHYIRDSSTAYECCKKMVSVLDVKNDRLAQVFIILSKYKLEIIKDQTIKKEMFLKLDALILKNFNKTKKLEPYFTDVWKILFEKVSGCKSTLLNQIIQGIA